jgi:hypothetical protein
LKGARKDVGGLLNGLMISSVEECDTRMLVNISGEMQKETDDWSVVVVDSAYCARNFGTWGSLVRSYRPMFVNVV